MSFFTLLVTDGAELSSFSTWRGLIDIAKKDCARKSRSFASLPTSWVVATIDAQLPLPPSSPPVVPSASLKRPFSSVATSSLSAGVGVSSSLVSIQFGRVPGTALVKRLLGKVSARKKFPDSPALLTQREDKEKAARTRWTRELWSLLQGTGTPVTRMSSGVAALRSVAAGRRALTLRARVYKLRGFFTWLFKERGQRFPRVVEHILDYLTFVSDSRCTRSSLISRKRLYAFLSLLLGLPCKNSSPNLLYS